MKLYSSIWMESNLADTPCPNCGEFLESASCSGCSYQDPGAVQSPLRVTKQTQRRAAKRLTLA